MNDNTYVELIYRYLLHPLNQAIPPSLPPSLHTIHSPTPSPSLSIYVSTYLPPSLHPSFPPSHPPPPSLSPSLSLPLPPYIGIGYAAVGVMIEMFTSWQSAEGLVNVPPSEAELKAIALAAETVRYAVLSIVCRCIVCRMPLYSIS